MDIGTYPSRDQRPVSITNFEHKEPVEDGIFSAWGFVEYVRPLSPEDIADYELRPSPSNPPLENEPLEIVPEVEQEAQESAPPTITAILTDTPFTQEQVDTILRDGGNQENSILRIAAYFMKDKALADNAAFLAREYKKGGKGYQFGDTQVSVWFDDTGLTLGSGKTALLDKNRVHLTWEQAAVHIRELLDIGEYLSRDVLDEAIDNERLELADRLIFFYRDDLRGFREYPKAWRSEPWDGHPADLQCVKALLDDAEERGLILARLEDDIAALRTDPDAPKRVWHDPDQLLADMRDSQIAPMAVPVQDTVQSMSFQRFITDDEVDSFFIGSGGKYNILSYFLHHSSAKDRSACCKGLYHNGGGSHALNGADDSWYNGFGPKLELTRGRLDDPYDKVILTGSAIAKRIGKLIESGRYLTRAELDAVPEYELRTLAQEIIDFYSGLPVDVPRPYDANGDRLDNHDRDTVLAMLDSPTQVASLVEAMRSIVEGTHKDDRDYRSRTQALHHMLAYQAGVFTLFPGLDDLPTPEQAEERAAPKPPREPHQFNLFEDEPEEPSPLPILRDVKEQRVWIDQDLTEREPPEIDEPEPEQEPETDKPEPTQEQVQLEPDEPEPQRAPVQSALSAPGKRPYKVGDTVYLENDRPYTIDSIGVNDVSLLPTDLPMLVPIFRSESISNFERLIGRNPLNHAISNFLASSMDGLSDDDLREVVVTMLGEREMETVTNAFARGATNADVAEALAEGYSRESGSFGLETGQAAFYRCQPGGLEIEIADKYDTKLAYTWSEIAAALRTITREMDFPVQDQVQEPEQAPELAPAEPEEDFFLTDGEVAEVRERLENPTPEDEAHIQGMIDFAVVEAQRFEEELEPSAEPPAPAISEQDVIDTALREWNGDPDSKRRVDQYMEIHGRERGTADYLRREYGDDMPAFPVVGAQLDLPWPRVQRRIAQLIAQGEFFAPDELTPLDPVESVEPAIPVEPEPALPMAGNYRITDDNLGEGGPKVRFAANMEAIRTLKRIEAQGRGATEPEQKILARYVGWGGLQNAFDDTDERWQTEYTELKDLLTPDEYTKARASVLNAHYTTPVVIRAIYDAIGKMGFRRGNVLDPSCGTGNFFGMVPEVMRAAKLYGIELDDISARIAGLLYPDATVIKSGFEQTNFPDNFFDVVIGNVPFGNYKVYDEQYNRHNFLIHDYFIAKSIDKVRTGGVVALITSNGVSGGTLDKRDSKARRYMAERCDLVGAIRLPRGTFASAAGTDVGMDILFLQKREMPRDLSVDTPDWVSVQVVHESEKEMEDGETKRSVLALNNYYREHPEMVLGDLEVTSGPFGPQLVCQPKAGELADQLREAVGHLEAELTEDEPALDDLADSMDDAIPADPNVRNFSYTMVDGQVYFRENSFMYPVDQPAATLDRIRGMVELRDCVHELIALQIEDGTDERIRQQQDRLNELYDAFTDEYGLINSSGNNRAFSGDSAYYLLCSLEILDEDSNLERKADMFTKRTIRKPKAITSVDTASEALAVSIGEKARVDLDYMTELSGLSREALIEDLRGVIFLNAGSAETQDKAYVTADEYLSGNIREKLAAAKAASVVNPALAVNVEALEKAMPKDLEASEISVRLGSTWVDKAYIQEFMDTLLPPSWRMQNTFKVQYVDYTGEWQITNKSKVPYNNIAARVTYGTERKNAYEIIEDTLNLRDTRVYDTRTVDGKEKRELNREQTTLAQQKQEAIKTAFSDWIWTDPQRRQTLVRRYNDLFNSSRPREYDGSHIQFSGMNPAFTMRDYQQNAIARILYGGNTLLAHEVGAGKTFEMVAAAMEGKRLGLCTKSLFAVPNHIIDQIASDFLRLYPAANVLVATKRDFEMRNRKKFCAKIATGDYDAIIMGHSQLEKIPISRERQENLLNEQLREIIEGIEELRHSGGERFTIKQLERTKKQLESRLEKLRAGKGKDDVVTFEQLGVDRLFVDEAHNYKELCCKGHFGEMPTKTLATGLFAAHSGVCGSEVIGLFWNRYGAVTGHGRPCNCAIMLCEAPASAIIAGWR